MTRILLLCTALLAVTARADIILSPEPGQFYGGWTAAENGPQFWNRHSWDGNACGIGFFLAGNMSRNCGYLQGDPTSGPSAALEYLASATDPNSALTDFVFGDSAGGVVTLQLELAAWSNSNVLGIYLRAPDGTIESTQALFSGPDHPPESVVFETNGRGFGFFITNPQGRTFYTESRLNPPADRGVQHFAVFRQSPAGAGDLRVSSYWLGVEDLSGGPGNSDRDFNDLVLLIQQVPEPATFATVGLATILGGIAVNCRSRRSRG
jgi:hypothetical protein